MGKESELWDDSALMNAFDDAMIKYKQAMHNRKQQKGISADGEEINVDYSENSINDNYETTRLVRVVDTPPNAVINNRTDVEEANNVPPFQQNHQANSSVPEPIVQTSSSNKPQTLEGSTNSQPESEYYQVLHQYYEIEKQRLNVLQQLQQVGHGYDYGYYQSQSDGSGSCAYTYCAPQENQDSTHYASKQVAPVVSSCCPCLTGLCPLVPGCSSSGQACISKMVTYSAPISSEPAKVSSLQNDPVVQMAMGAAERAIASIQVQTSDTSNVQREKDKEGISDSAEGSLTHTTSSETDLSVVLNAWFSAGFHTGKYLSEQSIAKRRNE